VLAYSDGVLAGLDLIRADVHPMEEAQGFKALLDLEAPTYSIEQIAAKTGKQPAFVAARLKLIDLVPTAVEAFYRDEIGVGHALLLAKLPGDQQEQALSACFREDWGASSYRKAKRILLPVRNLQFWIEQNVLLFLKDAPFDKRDAHLVAIAGNCIDCSKRTGHNKLLFSDLGKQDACTDPSCYQAKVSAHVAAASTAASFAQETTEFAGKWVGSALVKGRGTCKFGLEIGTQQNPDKPFTAYTNMLCVDMTLPPGGKMSAETSAIWTAERLAPESTVLSGSVVNGTMTYKTDRVVSHGQGKCDMESMEITPFGSGQVAAEWKDNCGGGEMTLAKIN
jgi:hypothetical protein